MDIVIDLWSDVLAARGKQELKHVDETYLHAICSLLKANLADEELCSSLLLTICDQVLVDPQVQRVIMKQDRLQFFIRTLGSVVGHHFHLTDPQLGEHHVPTK